MSLPLIESLNYRYNNPESEIVVDELIAKAFATKTLVNLSELEENSKEHKVLEDKIDQFKLWLSMSKEKGLVEKFENEIVVSKQQQLVK